METKIFQTPFLISFYPHHSRVYDFPSSIDPGLRGCFLPCQVFLFSTLLTYTRVNFFSSASLFFLFFFFLFFDYFLLGSCSSTFPLPRSQPSGIVELHFFTRFLSQLLISHLKTRSLWGGWFSFFLETFFLRHYSCFFYFFFILVLLLLLLVFSY